MNKVYDEALDPDDQLKAALQEAQSNSKLILLQIGGNWCGWCIKLHNIMDSDQTLKDYLSKNYIVLHINHGTNKTFDLIYSPTLQHYPWLCVVNSKGELLVEQGTDQLEKGPGHDPEKILIFLEGKKILGDKSNPIVGEAWKI